MADQETILVVDDDVDLLEFIAVTLQGCGFQTRAENNSAKIANNLDKYLKGVSAVMVDWVMPGVSGLELLKQIKESPTYNRVPVIMLTAKMSKEDTVAGIQAGAYYYVTKPFEAELVQSILRSAINDYYNYRNLTFKIEELALPIENLDNITFHLKSLREAERVRNILAQLCPEPQTASLGLNELINNAIEHGNLEFTFEEKSELLEADTFFQEMEKRQKKA